MNLVPYPHHSANLTEHMPSLADWARLVALHKSRQRRATPEEETAWQLPEVLTHYFVTDGDMRVGQTERYPAP